MKRILSILILIAIVFSVNAQTQQGYVKTKGRLGSIGQIIKGTRLSGATITVKGRNAVMSGNNGTFSLSIPSNTYFLQNVQKQGYVLMDPDVLSKQYVQSKNPLVLVMETPDEQTEDKLEAMEKIQATLQARLTRSRAEIRSLKEQNKLTQEEYRKRLQELADIQESDQQLVSEMAERYSKIDYDQLDDFNRRIRAYILNGELQKADSLLKTKGDINTRTADLRQLQEQNAKEEAELTKRKKKLEKRIELAQKEMEDIAKDCYSKFEIFKMQHMNDSAAYYIEKRASLDSTNIQWLLDAGSFYCNYVADYSKSLSIYNKILENVRKKEGENSYNAIDIYISIAYDYYEQAKYDLAIANYKKAIEIAKGLYGYDNPQVVNSLICLGIVYSTLENNEDALQCYYLALNNGACNVLDSVRCFINIAERCYERSKYDDALNYYMKAIELNHNPHSDKERMHLASCYEGLSVLYSFKDDYSKAFEYANKTLDLNRWLYGDNHPIIASNYVHIGSFYNKLSKYEEAITWFSKALAIDSLVYGQVHPQIALDYNNMGYAFNQLGQRDKALECYQKALEIDELFYGRNHSRVGTVLANIGGVYEDKHDYPQALKYDNEALEILKTIWGENHYKVASCYNNLGNIYIETHDFDKAEECLKKALSINLNLFDENNSHIAMSYNSLARLYNEMGDLEKAAKYMEKIPSILSKIYGEEHVNVAVTYYNVSVLNKKRGDYKKALELAEKAYNIVIKLLPEEHPTVKTFKNGIADIKAKMNK